MQPTYLSWVGYFSLIRHVDCFIFLDDVQFSYPSWQARNKILISQMPRWLAVPITRPNGLKTLINEVFVDDEKKWREDHMRKFYENYAEHPFFSELHSIHNVINDCSNLHISKINENLIIEICNYLDIKVNFFRSSSFNIKSCRSEKLYLLCQEVNADIYVSPPGSKEYLENDKFEKLYPINLEYFSYNLHTYTQKGIKEFIQCLSVYDLLANHGKNSINFI